MSDRNESITVSYTPLESGDAKSRWIRVEQERPEPETVSVAEAAEIVDRLYKIDPCKQGLGGGGEPADEEKEPAEEEVAAEMAGLLERADMCAPPEYWETTVRVLRSHKQPGYELRSETATVESTTPVRGSHRQDVEVSGAVIELDMPYDGGLTGIPAGVNWTVRGSTVNLDRPLAGRFVLRYDTWFDRIVLRIPMDSGGAPDDPAIRAAMEYAPGDPFAVAGRDTASSGGRMNRREPPSASIVAFWGRLAASCELEPPDQDDEVTVEELAELCEGGEEDPGGGGGGDDEPNDCWRSVTHYNRCNCSRRAVDEWTEMVSAPCDGAESGTELAPTALFGQYVRCEGEEDDVHDPEFYEKRCCHAPPPGLPRCRRTYAVYRGGHAIEGGADHWKSLYGDDVSLVAVMPKDGVCGDIVTEWIVPQRNCCDDVPPLEPYEDNPTTISQGGVVALRVRGGRHPISWRASAGLTFAGGAQYLPDGGQGQWVYADADACPNGGVQVDDGCTRIHMPLSLDTSDPDMTLAPDNATVAPEAHLSITAFNNRGPVQWSPGALRLISTSGEHNEAATFEAPDGFCGQTEVVASDACGIIATARVLSTAGRWVEVDGFDPCVAPWGGEPSGTPMRKCEKGDGDLYSVSADGYMGYVCVLAASVEKARKDSCPHEGGCDSPFEGKRTLCGYTGRKLMRWTFNCQPYSPHPLRVCYDLCYNLYYNCFTRSDGTQYEPQNQWHAVTMGIERLWRWECDNGE